jgi:lysyl-tRNA synthetase class 1
MLKRFVGTRTLNVTDIPTYMNEMDDLEDVYFGKKPAKDERELVKLRGLYEYCWALKPPQKPSVKVPYNLMTFLAKMAPKGSEEEFIAEKLRGYGHLQKSQTLDEGLRRRIEYASNWIKDFEEIKETTVGLSGAEKAAMAELVEVLKSEDDAEKIQNAIFTVAKKHGLQLGSFFKSLYMILLGIPQGPRLGPYLVAMGKQNVIDALQRALSKS